MAQEFADSGDCVLAWPLRAAQVPLNAVLKKVEGIVVHVFGVGLLRTSVRVFAVAEAIPIAAEATELVSRNERLKGNDSLSVPLPVRSAKELHVVDPVAGVSLGGKQLGNEGVSELYCRSCSAVSGFTDTVPLVNKPCHQRSPCNADSTSYDWYWYVQFLISILVLLEAAGLFGGGGAGGSHVKPSE